MSPSSRTLVGALAAALAWSATLAAQERPGRPGALMLQGESAPPSGNVRIYEATFNKFAAAIQPIQYRLPYTLKFTVPSPLPFTDDVTIELCSDTMTASVDGLGVNVTPYGITIDGKAHGSWCHLSFSNIDVKITAQVEYDAVGRTIRIWTSNAVVSPRVGFDVPEWVPDWAGLPSRIDVPLPAFSVGSSFAVPPIPFDTTPFFVQTSVGPRHLLLSGNDVQLIRQDGFIEIRGVASIR